MPAIDFSEVKGLDPIPEGVYSVEVVEATEGVSQSGNPKIDVRYKVLDGEYEGRILFEVLSFHPNALWRAKKTLQNLGFPADFNGEIDCEDLIGRLASALVVIEPSSGTDPDTGEPYPDRNRIKKLSPLEMTADDLL